MHMLRCNAFFMLGLRLDVEIQIMLQLLMCHAHMSMFKPFVLGAPIDSNSEFPSNTNHCKVSHRMEFTDKACQATV